MSERIPERYWYGSGAGSLIWALCLSPLTALYSLLSALRRVAFRSGALRQVRFAVPVIVVGNLSVGGTGKTPLVIALVEQLRAAGWKPGVVSRGYGGSADSYPLHVTAETLPTLSGDEPALIVQRTGCPFVVDPKRSRAVATLIKQGDVDVVISDDGLQHYAMARNFEWVVVDGQRRWGNGWRLPSGPLREGLGRLRSVDAIIVNGGSEAEASMEMHFGLAYNLVTGEERNLQEFAETPVHAVAGIGNPQRFFVQLGLQGLKVTGHAFEDHHAYTVQDFDFSEKRPILMTEKDAVKCRQFADADMWSVPVSVSFNTLGRQALADLLERLNEFRKPDG